MSDSTLDTIDLQQRQLDHYAAPFFSGVCISSGVILIGTDSWAAGVFPLAAAIGYWTRMLHLYWLEAKCLREARP